MRSEHSKIHDQKDLTPAQIEERAEQALDNVKSFFARYGIELEKKPKVKYLDMNCPLNARAAGVANIDIESLKRLMGTVGVTLTKSMYQHFDLEISDEAANEALAVVQNELSGIFEQAPLFKEGEDIDLFFPIRNMIDNLDSVMAHESWHLHESALGVTVTEPLIREATATYVENLIAGKSCANPVIKDHFDVVYKLGAAIVEEELADEENPLKALLNPGVRRKIESRFQREAMPLFYQKVRQSFNPDLSRSFQKQFLKTDPAYENFRKNPSAANLLYALTQRGYRKLAEDFGKQDIGKLLEYSQNLLKEN